MLYLGVFCPIYALGHGFLITYCMHTDQLKEQIIPRLRSALPTVAILVLFALLAGIYFAPAITEGKDIYQHDVAGASGTAQDVRDYQAETGQVSYWTGSLFGGMPMYQISPSYPSLSPLSTLQSVYTLQWPLTLLPSYSWLIFAMLVGFFVFMRAMGLSRMLALIGALAWAFSSYFLILIEAGHIWKLTTLAFIPPTIAGIVWLYRGRYVLGGVVTTLFAALQLMSNHVQMSYYFALVMVCLVGAFAWQALQARQYKHLTISTGILALSAVLALMMNASNLYHTWEYSRETMRGGSALATNAEAGGTVQKSGGLDKDYITQWSYGKAETLTLLIPNTYGGATGYLKDNPKAMDKVPMAQREIVGQMNHYWGDQPFTSGPVYVGAFVCLLFVLGLFVVRGPIKWALLTSTIISVALSWGHNMMWLTDLFIDYFPLYNKFRTVSSILVVAEFTIPTLAVMALVEVMREPKRILAWTLPLQVALGSTALICTVLWLMPSTFFSFVSEAEREMFSSMVGDPRLTELLSTLTSVRASILSADALRSLIVILLSLGVCLAYARGVVKRTVCLGLLCLITLVDLWQINKRYLNDDDFIAPELVARQATPITSADREIALDTDKHYRVFNTSVNSFNDATTSAHHRSVGGYHAAKLSRYQDLIDTHLGKGNKQAFDALNTRYFIFNHQGTLRVERNAEAYGPAWFVDEVRPVGTAQQEIDIWADSAMRRVATVEQTTAESLPQTLLSHKADTEPSQGHTAIQLKEYTPDRARYEVETDRERLLVFSEVYYPHGWTLTLDGVEQTIHRADYLLRATVVPAGRHVIEMRFAPQSIVHTERMAYIAQMLLLLAVLGSALLLWRRRRQGGATTPEPAEQ